MLNDIKLLIGLTDDSKDQLLNLLIEGAIEDAIALTGNEDIKNDLPYTIMKMVIYNYNRLGVEGLEQESYSGVSYTYSTDYPEDIIKMLDTKSAKKGRVYFV